MDPQTLQFITGEIQKIRESVLGVLDISIGLLALVLAIILAVVGFMAFKQGKDAEKKLQEMKVIVNKAEDEYSKIEDKSVVIENELKQLREEYRKVINENKANGAKLIEMLNNGQTIVDEMKQMQKSRRKVATKQEFEALQLQFNVLKQKILSQLTNTISPNIEAPIPKVESYEDAFKRLAHRLHDTSYKNALNQALEDYPENVKEAKRNLDNFWPGSGNNKSN